LYTPPMSITSHEDEGVEETSHERDGWCSYVLDERWVGHLVGGACARGDVATVKAFCSSVPRAAFARDAQGRSVLLRALESGDDVVQAVLRGTSRTELKKLLKGLLGPSAKDVLAQYDNDVQDLLQANTSEGKLGRTAETARHAWKNSQLERPHGSLKENDAGHNQEEEGSEAHLSISQNDFTSAAGGKGFVGNNEALLENSNKQSSSVSVQETSLKGTPASRFPRPESQLSPQALRLLRVSQRQLQGLKRPRSGRCLMDKFNQARDLHQGDEGEPHFQSSPLPLHPVESEQLAANQEAGQCLTQRDNLSICAPRLSQCGPIVDDDMEPSFDQKDGEQTLNTTRSSLKDSKGQYPETQSCEEKQKQPGVNQEDFRQESNSLERTGSELISNVHQSDEEHEPSQSPLDEERDSPDTKRRKTLTKIPQWQEPSVSTLDSSMDEKNTGLCEDRYSDCFVHFVANTEDVTLTRQFFQGNSTACTLIHGVQVPVWKLYQRGEDLDADVINAWFALLQTRADKRGEKVLMLPTHFGRAVVPALGSPAALSLDQTQTFIQGPTGERLELRDFELLLLPMALGRHWFLVAGMFKTTTAGMTFDLKVYNSDPGLSPRALKVGKLLARRFFMRVLSERVPSKDTGHFQRKCPVRIVCHDNFHAKGVSSGIFVCVKAALLSKLGCKHPDISSFHGVEAGMDCFRTPLAASLIQHSGKLGKLSAARKTPTVDI